MCMTLHTKCAKISIKQYLDDYKNLLNNSQEMNTVPLLDLV